MERDRFEPILPREPGDETFNINIAGESYNLMDRLRHRAPISPYSDKMKPGDDEAQSLLRVFTNIGVTPAEYRIAMPTLFELVAKKDGGFDPDLINVTRFLMKRTLLLRVAKATFSARLTLIAQDSPILPTCMANCGPYAVLCGTNPVWNSIRKN